MNTKTPEICRTCAGAGIVDRYNPQTKRLEPMTCPGCGGSGTVLR